MTDLLIPMQLAKEVPLAKVKFPCYLEPKYDGVRLAIIKRGNDVLIRTRNGKQAHLPYITTKLQEYNFEGVVECEVTLVTGKMEDRTKVSGMINSSLHGNPIDERSLHFFCFDYLSLDDWDGKLCHSSYNHRRVRLAALPIFSSYQFIFSQAQVVNNAAEAQDAYASLIEAGYEGAMLKHAESKYEFKRSAAWVKMKETKTADLTCVSYIFGAGKYEGMIGSLVCVGEVEGVQVEVNVGSGMTDYDRAQSFDKYKDKTIEVKYNTVIQDKNGNVHSLFLPRFVGVRFDK